MKSQKVFLSLAILTVLFPGVLFAQIPDVKPVKFVFMTDIHIDDTLNAPAKFKNAVMAINREHPEFIVTGGDLVMDAIGQKFSRADSLFTLYSEMIKGFKAPVINGVGNHENFAMNRNSGPDTLHPLAGTKLYEQRFGKPYRTYEFNGWKFFFLNSVSFGPDRKYTGEINAEQIEWIKHELAGTDSLTPVVIVTHIPLMTVESQLFDSATAPNYRSDVIVNARQVLDLFRGHNLKLVLQGHLHYFEDIYVNGIHFITGGAISGAWWEGPYHGTKPGYLLVRGSKTGEITYEYKDYGWPVSLR